jgi:hypothetical protein
MALTSTVERYSLIQAAAFLVITYVSLYPLRILFLLISVIVFGSRDLSPVLPFTGQVSWTSVCKNIGLALVLSYCSRKPSYLAMEMPRNLWYVDAMPGYHLYFIPRAFIDFCF